MGERRTRRTAAGWTAACALAAGLLTACGSSGGQPEAAAGTSASSSSAPAPAASAPAATSSGMPATTTTIMIEHFAYATPATVAPGSRVRVMNMDGEAHTVTADSGTAFDVPSPAGQTVAFTAPTTPGSYPFHCTYHGNMHGVLVVG